MEVYACYAVPFIKVIIIDDLTTKKTPNDPVLVVEQAFDRLSFSLISLSAFTSKMFRKTQMYLDRENAIKYVKHALNEYSNRPQDYPSFDYQGISQQFLEKI